MAILIIRNELRNTEEFSQLSFNEQLTNNKGKHLYTTYTKAYDFLAL